MHYHISLYSAKQFQTLQDCISAVLCRKTESYFLKIKFVSSPLYRFKPSPWYELSVTGTANNGTIYFFSKEIPNFLSEKECDHIIELARKEGMEDSRTLLQGIKQDTRALGKNTKVYFDLWDVNKDGEIDMDEVKKL